MGKGVGQQEEHAARKGVDNSVMVVGVVGLGCGCADIANAIAKADVFRDGVGPVEVQSARLVDQSRIYMYLAAGAMLPQNIMAGYRASEIPSETVTDYVEDKQIQYVLNLTLVLMVSHVVLFVHPQGQMQVDLSLFRLLRLSQTIRSGLTQAILDLTRSRPPNALSGTQFSPGRVLPIAAFLFTRKPPYTPPDSLEQQLRTLLKSAHLSGTASDRDGPDTPVVMLDPHRCAFFIDHPRAPDASTPTQVQPVHDFISRQAQYIHRQMMTGGKRYFLPSAATWTRELPIISSLLRLDKKNNEAHVFARLHPMINPLFKYSYSRSCYASQAALDNLQQFLGRASQDVLQDPAVKQHQWQQSVATYNRYALGPLRKELKVQLKKNFEQTWQGTQEGHEPSNRTRYDDEGERVTGVKRDSSPKQVRPVISTCGTAIVHVSLEERDDHEVTLKDSSHATFMSLHSTQGTEQHLVNVTYVVITNDLPFSSPDTYRPPAAGLVEPTPQTPSPKRPVLTVHTAGDYFEGLLPHKNKPPRPTFKQGVQKVVPRVSSDGRVYLYVCDSSPKPRYAVDEPEEPVVQQAAGEVLVGGAVVGQAVFDAVDSVLTLPARMQQDGKKREGKRSRRKKGEVTIKTKETVPKAMQLLHPCLYVMLEYACLLSGVRWATEPSMASILAPENQPGAALPACDIPLFALSPPGLNERERRNRENISQLLRIYFITDNTDAVWSVNPVFAFFRNNKDRSDKQVKKDFCHSPDSDEVLHELVKGDSPVALPSSSVVCLRLPKTYPVEMSDYKNRRNTCYLLHGFATLSYKSE